MSDKMTKNEIELRERLEKAQAILRALESDVELAKKLADAKAECEALNKRKEAAIVERNAYDQKAIAHLVVEGKYTDAFKAAIESAVGFSWSRENEIALGNRRGSAPFREAAEAIIERVRARDVRLSHLTRMVNEACKRARDASAVVWNLGLEINDAKSYVQSEHWALHNYLNSLNEARWKREQAKAARPVVDAAEIRRKLKDVADGKIAIVLPPRMDADSPKGHVGDQDQER